MEHFKTNKLFNVNQYGFIKGRSTTTQLLKILDDWTDYLELDGQIDATSEYRSKSAMSLQRRPVDPKFQVEGVAPTNHSSSQKTRLNDLLYGIKIWQIFLPFCQNARVWQTDGQTAFSWLEPCIQCSAAKAQSQNM